MIEERDGTDRRRATTRRSIGALLRAAERLAQANGKLVTAGDEYAKRTRGSRRAGSTCCAGSPRPAPTTSCGSSAVGRTRRLRIAPVAAGETIAHALLEWRPVIGGVGDARRRAAVPGARARRWASHADAAPGHVGRASDDDGRVDLERGPRATSSVQTPSSFDWKTQGILYVGKDLPDPGRGHATRGSTQSADRLCELVNAAGGRALVLCTSHAERRAASPRCCARAPTTTCSRRAIATSAG